MSFRSSVEHRRKRAFVAKSLFKSLYISLDQFLVHGHIFLLPFPVWTPKQQALRQKHLSADRLYR